MPGFGRRRPASGRPSDNRGRPAFDRRAGKLTNATTCMAAAVDHVYHDVPLRHHYLRKPHDHPIFCPIRPGSFGAATRQRLSARGRRAVIPLLGAAGVGLVCGWLLPWFRPPGRINTRIRSHVVIHMLRVALAPTAVGSLIFWMTGWQGVIAWIVATAAALTAHVGFRDHIQTHIGTLDLRRP